jgi:hypothetical protein
MPIYITLQLPLVSRSNQQQEGYKSPWRCHNESRMDHVSSFREMKPPCTFDREMAVIRGTPSLQLLPFVWGYIDSTPLFPSLPSHLEWRADHTNSHVINYLGLVISLHRRAQDDERLYSNVFSLNLPAIPLVSLLRPPRTGSSMNSPTKGKTTSLSTLTHPCLNGP